MSSRAKRGKSNKVIQLRESQFRRALRDVASDQNMLTQLAYLAALRDGDGFGTVRLTRVCERANKYLRQVDEGRVSVRDLKEMLGEEVGITLEKAGVSGGSFCEEV